MNLEEIGKSVNDILKDKKFYKHLFNTIAKEVKESKFPNHFKNKYTTEDYLVEAYTLWIKHIDHKNNQLDYFEDNDITRIHKNRFKLWIKNSIKFILSSNGNLFRNKNIEEIDDKLFFTSNDILSKIYYEKNKNNMNYNYDETIDRELTHQRQFVEYLIESGIMKIKNKERSNVIVSKAQAAFLNSLLIDFLKNKKLSLNEINSISAVFTPQYFLDTYRLGKKPSNEESRSRDFMLKVAKISQSTFKRAILNYNIEILKMMINFNFESKKQISNNYKEF